MTDQKIFLNPGLSKIKSILNDLQVKKVFIVCGNNSFLPISKSIKFQLENYKKYFFNIGKNFSSIDILYEGIEQFNSFNPDIIVAIGGGSVIDMAKLIKVLANEPNKIKETIQNKKIINCFSKVPFLVMPTTAGSGSESTHFSVIYIGGKKYSVSSQVIIPNQIILDVDLVKSMPDNIAYNSLFDALSQATESLWSKFANNISKKYAMDAIKKILSNFNQYISERNYESFTQIIEASNLSGRAINITKTTAPHALSYSLTYNFGIPHGNAVAILLPETFRVSYNKMSKLEQSKCDDIISLFNCKNIDEFCIKWYKLMSSCNLSIKARDFGVKSSDINLVINEVNIERLSGHPVILNKNDFKKILKSII